MKNYYNRKFGQYDVEVTMNGVSIVGDYNSNYGTVYPHKVGQTDNLGNPCQLFGMEWGYGLTKGIVAYINKSINSICKA